MRNTITIGKSDTWNQYLNGLIDEVRIYEQTLSQAQIKQLYAEGAARHGLLAETE